MASSGLYFFSGFWHIGKFGGGKKDGPPLNEKLTAITHTHTQKIVDLKLDTLVFEFYQNWRFSANYKAENLTKVSSFTWRDLDLQERLGPPQ